MNRFSFKLPVAVDMYLLEYIIVMGLLIRYVGHDFFWRTGLVILTLLYLRKKKSLLFVKRYKSLLILVAIDLLLVFVNGVVNGLGYHFTANLKVMLFPEIVIIIIFSLYTYNSNHFKRTLLGNFWLFNAWWVINLLVVSVQVTGNPFMIKSEWLAANSYYQDLCCGLFGLNGTHELAIYGCFIIIYNFVYSDQVEKRSRSLILKLYTIISVVASLWLSMMNDNMSYFIMVPLTVFVFYYHKVIISNDNPSKKMTRGFGVIALALAVVIIAPHIPVVDDYIQNHLNFRLNSVLLRGGTTVLGSNERLAIAQRAFTEGYGWGLGSGFGRYTWTQAGTLGFIHYGLSSLGSFIVQNGIWHFIIHMSVFVFIFHTLYTSNRRRSIASVLVVTAYVLFLTFYTVLFTAQITALWTMFMFASFSLAKGN